MSLQVKLYAFKADFQAGKPPYSVRHSAIEAMHRATAELIASGAAQRAKKAGDVAPSFSLKDPEGDIVSSDELLKKVRSSSASIAAWPPSLPLTGTTPH
jgi:hypothetical protein